MAPAPSAPARAAFSAAAVSSLTLGASANSRGSRASLQMGAYFTKESCRNFVSTYPSTHCLMAPAPSAPARAAFSAAAVSSLTLGASANSRGSRASLQMGAYFTSESCRNFVSTYPSTHLKGETPVL